MAQTLPVSRLVSIDVNLAPAAAAGRNFGNLLVLGDSDVISGLERIRQYASASKVANDFGTMAPEYLAAQLYFGQTPQPTAMSVGRWLRTATAAQLDGAILTAVQASLSNFLSITSGGFDVTIDGTIHHLLAMDFSAQTNLNGVASVVTTALSSAGTCVWNGSQFVITSASSGSGVKATGAITLTGQPTALDTVTVNGVVVTFVAASPTGNQVLIGSTFAQTAVNLNTFLNASVAAGIAAASYSVASGVVTVTYKTVGTGGNSFTLTESAANLTVSGATLTGGAPASSVSFASSPASGQDVSSLMGLTSALALPLVPGYAAESPLDAVVALDDISNIWYGVIFAASTQPTDNQNLAVAAAVQSFSTKRIFGVNVMDTGALSALVTSDLGSQFKGLGYTRSFVQFSTKSAYAIASFIGRAFSVNFEGASTTINLMYKQEPGVLAENLSTSQANVLQSKRYNVFAAYSNDTNIIQYGVMSGPAFFDEIHGLDWLADSMQTACFNVNYTSSTKVPQTDQGVNQFVNAIGKVCDQAITNGLGAPGTWTAPGFGQLLQGQYLKSGYYIYAQPVALQSDSDRAARKAPPIQVAFKFAGAIDTVDVLVNVNR